MTLSNLAQEDIWLDAWDDLYDLIKKYPKGYILIPEYTEVDLDTAQGWIQDAAYDSNRIIFSVTYFKGRESILINKAAA